MTPVEILRLTEDEARDLLESLRWPDGPVCPHCGQKERVYKLEGQAHRKGLYKCGVCRKQFTVTVNTIFHRSHVSLNNWVAAVYFMCSSKKGYSAHQLHRTLGCTYKTAWFMFHRIRHAMDTQEFAEALSGVVEVDETYVGGKPRKGNGEPPRYGRGTKKTPVVALVERNGRVRAGSVQRVDSKTLHSIIKANVTKEGSAILTDDFASYKGIGDHFEFGHASIPHSSGIYSENGVDTNTVESFFALMKRGVYGIFHHVSKQHLDRYCNEFAFRWNTRKDSDIARAFSCLRSVGGKRLTYAA